MTLVETMKPRERVLAALEGKPVDRPPVSNPSSIVTVELMDLVDAHFPAATRDPELNARLVATGHTELGYDSVAVNPTLVIEASAMGCEIQWEQKDNWPTVRMNKPIWKSLEDIRVPAGFLENGEVQAVVKSIEMLRQEFGDEVAIIGKVTGPWTVGYHGFGVQDFLLMSIDDPDTTLKCLHRMKEVTVLFAEAQIDAGADALNFADHATGDLVSGEYYRKFLLEIHQEMAERLKAPLILHICGKTMDRLEYIAQSGMAAFHFDSKNDAYEAMEIVDGRIKMIGNLNCPETMYAGSPEDVRQEVYRALDAGVHAIAPEGSVPLATRLDNLLEIPKAVRDWCEEHNGA